MKHALIERATKAELKVAEEASDWLLDAIATATQDRRFLRGDAKYDRFLSEAIMMNGLISCLRSINAIRISERYND